MWDIDFMDDELLEKNVFNYAIWLLARRDYSEFSLRDKLQKKSNDEAVVERVIFRVQELGYQSDERYVTNFIAYAVSQKKGPMWICSKLREKGLNTSLVNKILDETAIDWQLLANELLAQKFKTVCADYKEKNRRFRFLISRGYTSSIVVQSIESHHQLFSDIAER